MSSAVTHVMPSDAFGQRDVLVGRFCRDLSDPTGRMLMMSKIDQFFEVAALNAVQIVERLLER